VAAIGGTCAGADMAWSGYLIRSRPRSVSMWRRLTGPRISSREGRGLRWNRCRVNNDGLLAAGENTGVGIVVLPGGGYSVLAIDLEGTEVCDWLTSRGITCVLLKYRVPDSGPAYHDDCHCKHSSESAPCAGKTHKGQLGSCASHAREWHIDPHKIGVLGFSAGGHLVANISTHFGHRSYAPVDAADRVSCRPDFAVAIYPGHMLENTTKEIELNPEIPVTTTAGTPPTFLLQNEDDNVTV